MSSAEKGDGYEKRLLSFDVSTTEEEPADKPMIKRIDFNKRSTVGRATTVSNELPFNQNMAVLAMALGLIASYFSSNVLYPIAPSMVKNWYPNLSDSSVGFYAGYLDSAFYMGPLLTSVRWTRLSDEYGRKKMIQYAMIGTSICALLFGLSYNYWMALTIRFLWGSLDASSAITKTAMGDLSKLPGFTISQARLFSLVGMSSGLGRTCGATIGGWLGSVYGNGNPNCSPITQVFCSFPYFLPLLATMAFLLTTLAFVHFFFPETRDLQESTKSRKRSHRVSTIFQPNSKSAAKISIHMGDRDINTLEDVDFEGVSDVDEESIHGLLLTGDDSSAQKNLKAMKSSQYNDPDKDYESPVFVDPPEFSTSVPINNSGALLAGERAVVVNSSMTATQEPSKSIQDRNETVVVGGKEDSPSASVSKSDTKSKQSSIEWSEVWKEHDMLKAVFLYFLLSMYATGFNSVVPIWMYQPANDRGHGFGFTSNQIGTVWAMVGPFYVVTQLFVYTRLCDWLGYIRTTQYALFVSASFCFLLPFLSLEGFLGTGKDGKKESSSTEWMQIMIVACVVGIVMSSRVMANSCAFIYINNASPRGQEMRATANGLGQMMGSLGRLLAPVIFCNTFAGVVSWNRKIGETVPILNYRFVFYMLSGMAIFVALFLEFGFPDEFEARVTEAKAKKDAARKANEAKIRALSNANVK